MTDAAMTPARRLRNIIGGSAGNLVEWFDWFAYAAFTVYFAPVFFPSGDTTAEYLKAAAVLAVACASAPVTTPTLDQARADFVAANNTPQIAAQAPLAVQATLRNAQAGMGEAHAGPPAGSPVASQMDRLAQTFSRARTTG